MKCSENNGAAHRTESAKEKRIIEELLAGCSPIVQRIINVHNRFTIPPPSEKEENDEIVSMTSISQLHTNDTNNVSICIMYY